MGPMLVYYHPVVDKLLLVREMELGKNKCAIYDGYGDKVKFWFLSSVYESGYEFIGEF